MTSSTLDALTAASAFDGTEEIYVLQGGLDRKGTSAQQRTLTLLSKLSAFAATTSAELAGVISDETGSGALVFGTAPTISAPNITGHPTLEGVTPTGATGTGNLVFSDLATFVAPVLGAATATSINKVAITAPAASATLTIANTKTFTVSNTLTLAGTDATVMTFPATSATIARTDAANTFTGVQTFSTPIATASVAAMTATVGGGVPTPPNNTTTFLRGDGTFATPASGAVTIGTTTIASGTTTRLLYDNGGVVGEIAGVTSDGTNLTHASSTLTLSGAISAAAWTTTGARIKGASASLTDSSSSGTVAAAYTNLHAGCTILASSATTYTNYFGSYFTDPVASTNVTMTNKYAVGMDSSAVGIGTPFQVSTAGLTKTTNLGSASAVCFGAGSSGTGLFSAGLDTDLSVSINGTRRHAFGAAFFAVLSDTGQITIGAGLDVVWSRIAAANMRLGGPSKASPVANTLTIGESSRPATDSNIGGANGTAQSGLGTGNATPSKLILQSPIAVASGTGAQTQTTGLTINVGTAVLSSYAVASLPSASAAGAGATAFVTDASTTLILGLGGAVTGGGANKVPVYSDGTNWIYG